MMTIYRDMYILTSVDKTMQKQVHKHVHCYLKLHNIIITYFRSGFTAGVNKLFELYKTFRQALDEGKEVRAVSMI